MCVLSRPLKALRVMGEPLSVLCTYVRTFFSLIMEERGEGRGILSTCRRMTDLSSELPSMGIVGEQMWQPHAMLSSASIINVH